MNNILTIIGIISTILVSSWAVFKYIILDNYRLDNDLSKKLINRLKNKNVRLWLLSKDKVKDPKYPDIFEVLVYLNGACFYFNRNERLLTAGWQSKESVSYIVFPRWQKKKIDIILDGSDQEDNTIPIMALVPRGSDRLGELICESNPNIYLSKDIYQDIEEDLKLVLDGKKRKTGCLLYGPPGNGKSQFIKYLSKKYCLPIYIVYLNPEYNNLDMALMFATIPQRCIVLMEDFDNYFHGRECSMKNDQVKFTFDSFINALDGVHNDYKQVMFVMTANDISKIDDSIKHRPSRFRFVKEVGPPNEEVRMKILNNKELVEQTAGLSLDKVFSYADK